jgi:hypothetical protein
MASALWFVVLTCCCCCPQEPNHHKTYVVLLDALAHKELSKNVLSTTYYYCRCGDCCWQPALRKAASSCRMLP